MSLDPPALAAPAITELLQAAEQGDAGARERLLGAVYEELRTLARRLLAGDRARLSVAPTELVHGAALKLLAQQRLTARDRAHFLAYAAQVMRQVLLDHVRRERASKRSAPMVTLVSQLAEEPQADVDFERLHDALEKLAQASPDLATLVELRYFGGLTIDEIAVLQDSSPATVKRAWRVARAWLRDALGEPAGS